MRLLVLCVAILCAVGCGGGAPEGADARALMAAGQDCIKCHIFSAAGTVFTDAGAAAPAVAVVIGGVTLTSNDAGNFFTTTHIEFPATPEVRSGGSVRRMPQVAPSGACNACHGVGSTSPIAGP